MNPILELQQKRAAVVGQAAALVILATNEKRAMSGDEISKYDAFIAEAETFRETIKRVEMQAAVNQTLGEQRAQIKEKTGVSADEQVEVFRTFLRFGPSAVPADKRSNLIPGNQYAPNFRASEMPEEFRAAQSELTGALGGYVVPQGFYPEVQTALKYYNGVIQAGPTQITTSMGNDLPIPTSNDTANEGQILGESSPETSLEVPFNQVIMKAFKYSTRLILVPIELLQDSGVDIQAYIVKQLGIRLGRITNRHFTVGTGTGQPRGLVIDSVLGKTGASGQTSTIIYDDLVDLKYSVDRAYRQNGKWMMNDTTLSIILKLKDTNGRPLILDYLQTLQAGEPEKILGQQLVVNPFIADMGVSAKSIVYGDFSAYWVRWVMSLMMMRLVERYADAGQVAFLGFMRADGRMVDAGTHPLKYYQNAAS